MQKIGVTIKIRNSCMSNSVEALILFNKEHQGLLNVHLGWGGVGWGRGGPVWGGKGGCVMLHCFREVQCQQVLTYGNFDISYLML